MKGEEAPLKITQKILLELDSQLLGMGLSRVKMLSSDHNSALTHAVGRRIRRMIHSRASRLQLPSANRNGSNPVVSKEMEDYIRSRVREQLFASDDSHAISQVAKRLALQRAATAAATVTATSPTSAIGSVAQAANPFDSVAPALEDEAWLSNPFAQLFDASAPAPIGAAGAADAPLTFGQALAAVHSPPPADPIAPSFPTLFVAAPAVASDLFNTTSAESNGAERAHEEEDETDDDVQQTAEERAAFEQRNKRFAELDARMTARMLALMDTDSNHPGAAVAQEVRRRGFSPIIQPKKLLDPNRKSLGRLYDERITAFLGVEARVFIDGKPRKSTHVSVRTFVALSLATK